MNSALLVSFGLVLVACLASAVPSFGVPQKAVVLSDDEPIVDHCQCSCPDGDNKCCYTNGEKSAARGRRVVVRPDNYDWIKRDDRVSIDVVNCEAKNGDAPGLDHVTAPIKLVNADGIRTLAATKIKFNLQKLKDANNVPYFEGYICPFVLGAPTHSFNTVKTVITCDIVYCDTRSTATSPAACRVEYGAQLAP